MKISIKVMNDQEKLPKEITIELDKSRNSTMEIGELRAVEIFSASDEKISGVIPGVIEKSAAGSN